MSTPLISIFLADVEAWLKSDRFDAVVTELLRQTEGVDDGGRSFGARIGGIHRRFDQRSRVKLTGIILTQIGATPTQHVARKVMERVFGGAVEITKLNEHFAKTGRDASAKYTAGLEEALEARPELVKEAQEAFQRVRGLLHHRLKDALHDRRHDAQRAEKGAV